MSIYEISIKIIEGKISKLDDFSLNELKKEITDNGGIFRVSPDLTIKEYLEILEETGIIKYDLSNKKYHVLYFSSEN